MTEPARSADRDQLLPEWEKQGAAPAAWRIAENAVIVDRSVSFFPDQKPGPYEQLLFSMPVMIHSMDAAGRIATVNHR